MLPLMSCVTTKSNIPLLTFPEFPALPEQVVVSGDNVIVPKSWIVDLAEYKLRIEMLEKTYKEVTE